MCRVDVSLVNSLAFFTAASLSISASELGMRAPTNPIPPAPVQRIPDYLIDRNKKATAVLQA